MNEIRTNLDNIRAMGKSELAAFLGNIVKDNKTCSDCPARKECKDILENNPLKYLNRYDSCAGIIEEWLGMKVGTSNVH